VKALAPLLAKAKRIVVVEASSGQLEDELRLAVSKAELSAPPIDNVRRRGGVLPQQVEMWSVSSAGTAVRKHEGVAV